MKTTIAGLLLALLLLSPFCRKNATGGEEEPGTFTIHNLGVRFAPYNPGTGKAGDFIFYFPQNKIFLEFGAVVGDGQGGTKELPTFEYLLDKGAWITAIASGTVTRRAWQNDTQDWEFAVRSDENPDWEVGYDHLKNIRVQEGDHVMAGDTLGNPGTWTTTLGRFEIMINNYETGLSYCPFCCFLPESTIVYQNRVRLLVDQWEAFKGDTLIYDDHLWPVPGCRMESMVTY